MPKRPEPPVQLVDRLSAICMALPEAQEVDAWAGISWRIRGHTFAHVLQIDGGWPPAYVRAANTSGPATVVTFQADEPERIALTAIGAPFFVPRWRPGIVGVLVRDDTDWAEVGEFVAESYCLLAPRKLAQRVRPHDDG